MKNHGAGPAKPVEKIDAGKATPPKWMIAPLDATISVREEQVPYSPGAPVTAAFRADGRKKS